MLILVRKHAQFVRFCVVGASGVAVNLLAIWVFLRLLGVGAHEATLTQANLAAVFGWVVSVASNFALNDRWTFARKEASYQMPGGARLLRYYGAAASGLALQLAVLNVVLWLSARLPVPEAWQPLRFYAANLCGIGAGTVVNYVMSKRFVFRRGLGS